MGLFDKIKIKVTNKVLQWASSVRGYAPSFSQFGEDIMNDDTVLTIVNRILNEYSKLNPSWCIPSAKIKEWLPAKYFFEYLFFFRLQAFKELYYAFSAILSHMNEPATKETDNQCNKKTTNLRE